MLGSGQCPSLNWSNSLLQFKTIQNFGLLTFYFVYKQGTYDLYVRKFSKILRIEAIHQFFWKEKSNFYRFYGASNTFFLQAKTPSLNTIPQWTECPLYFSAKKTWCSTNEVRVPHVLAWFGWSVSSLCAKSCCLVKNDGAIKERVFNTTNEIWIF